MLTKGGIGGGGREFVGKRNYENTAWTAIGGRARPEQKREYRHYEDLSTEEKIRKKSSKASF